MRMLTKKHVQAQPGQQTKEKGSSECRWNNERWPVSSGKERRKESVTVCASSSVYSTLQIGYTRC